MSFISILQGGKAAAKVGTYNNSLAQRDAAITRQEQQRAVHFYENVDKPRFEKSAEQIKDQLVVSYLNSGVTFSGTPIDAYMDQDYELRTDAAIMDYNSEIGAARAENAAKLTEARGMLAQWQGKLLKQQSYYDAGQSLLNTGMSVYGTQQGSV